MASVDVELVKCACSDCVCIVRVDRAVTREGRPFCCDDCADGHTAGAGCQHAGCTSHG